MSDDLTQLTEEELRGRMVAYSRARILAGKPSRALREAEMEIQAELARRAES